MNIYRYVNKNASKTPKRLIILTCITIYMYLFNASVYYEKRILRYDISSPLTTKVSKQLAKYEEKVLNDASTRVSISARMSYEQRSKQLGIASTFLKVKHNIKNGRFNTFLYLLTLYIALCIGVSKSKLDCVLDRETRKIFIDKSELSELKNIELDQEYIDKYVVVKGATQNDTRNIGKPSKNTSVSSSSDIVL